jgi:hypothetical protein
MHVLTARIGGRAKKAAHLREFRRLWQALEIIAEAVSSAGGTITIEWPRYNAYWKLASVKTFIQKHGLQTCFLDGCAIGLRGQGGLLIKKPWCLESNMPTIPTAFNAKVCTLDHEHTPCAGKDTRPTGGYTHQFAKIAHASFRKHCANKSNAAVTVRNGANGGDTAKVAPAAATVRSGANGGDPDTERATPKCRRVRHRGLRYRKKRTNQP